jgi:site-specific DNA-cytosine methylase
MKRGRESAAPHRWYDLFCGGGLAAYGARAVGFEIVRGVDHNPDAIAAFQRNFPEAEAKLRTLGEESEAQWPDPVARIHVHLSPPCGELSSAKAGPRDAEGAALLRWSIEQAVGRKYASWSVETVVSPETKPIVAALVAAHPKHVASAQIDAANLGSPQSRVRLIVGPPALIDRLRRTPCPPRVSIRQAYEAAGIPTRAPYVKNHSVPPALRSIEDVTPTVCASRALIWCDYRAETVKCMNSADSRLLMGLDSGYALCGKHYVDQRVLGNGVCFHVARGIAQAAMGGL